MQRKEQKVKLLEDLPDQDEYEMAQPKVRASSRRSGSRLTKGPLGGTGPQAIAGTARAKRTQGGDGQGARRD